MTDSETTPPGSPVEATGTWPTLRQPMSLGINITNSERMLFPGTPHFADLLAMSQAAAGAGFEVLWFDDHFSFTREDDLRGAWECWTQMAAIAAVLPDIHLGPMVACTAYRNPGVIAKMTEMIQDISEGRFILGLGAGWHKPEYDQFGLRFEPRVSQFEEAIHIIHGLVRHGEVDFQGTYSQANNAVNLPRAASGSQTPILVGSTGDRMLKSLVRYADAWNGGGTIDDIKAKMARVDAACAAVGRDPKSVVRTSGITIAGEGYDKDSPGVLTGSVEDKVEGLRALAGLGIQHVMVRVDPSTPETIAALAPVVAGLHAT